MLNRTKLVDATIATVEKNLAEGALLVIVVLFLLLGNFRAALITALVIPHPMLMTATGMVEGKISANLMSLGAIDFGLIVDGAVIIAENCLRRLAERQHELGRGSDARRAAADGDRVGSKEMIQPTVFGQAIIITVYVPLLTFTGVEGKMFEPMALTVIFALVAAFVLSLTFVPALVAHLRHRPGAGEGERPLIRGAKRVYAPLLGGALRRHWLRHVGAPWRSVRLSVCSCSRGSGRSSSRRSTKRHRDARHAHPQHSLTAVDSDAARGRASGQQLPEVAFVFSKTGTAEMAADPMPPNVSDTFIILKPQVGVARPDAARRTELVRKIAGERSRALPGNNYEFTQPIQMRFNELIAGVRGDVAVKVSATTSTS